MTLGILLVGLPAIKPWEVRAGERYDVLKYGKYPVGTGASSPHTTTALRDPLPHKQLGTFASAAKLRLRQRFAGPLTQPAGLDCRGHVRLDGGDM